MIVCNLRKKKVTSSFRSFFVGKLRQQLHDASTINTIELVSELLPQCLNSGLHEGS